MTSRPAGHFTSRLDDVPRQGRTADATPAPEDLERLAALRHLVGGGHFGGGPMFDRPFGGGRGRKRRGDVRTALLLLLPRSRATATS